MAEGDLLASLEKQEPKKSSVLSPWTWVLSRAGLGASLGSLHGVMAQEQGQRETPKPSPARGGEKAPAIGQPGQLCPGPGRPSRTASHCPRDSWQSSAPHEQGLGTSHTGTQLLPATNKACLMPETAGCLWALTRSRVSPWHGTALPPTTTLSPVPHGVRVAEDQATALSTSSRSGCPRARLPSPLQRSSHQRSQLTSSHC